MVRMGAVMDFTWSTNDVRTAAEFYSADGEPDLCELFTGSWRNPFLIIDSAVARLWDSRLQPLTALPGVMSDAVSCPMADI